MFHTIKCDEYKHSGPRSPLRCVTGDWHNHSGSWNLLRCVTDSGNQNVNTSFIAQDLMVFELCSCNEFLSRTHTTPSDRTNILRPDDHVIDRLTCLPEEYKTETRGYGNTHDTVMRPRCVWPTIMAVRDMTAASKLKTLGCPASILADTVYDPICTEIQAGDCTLPFDLTKRDPYLECTGVVECNVGTDWQDMLVKCGSSFMERSHIMSMDYNCIYSANISVFNTAVSKTDVTETYISNEGFPSAMTSSSGGTCFITSCSTGVTVGLIDLRLSESGGICQQSLKIIDGGTATVFDCHDNNNLQYKQRYYTSVTSSIYVTLTVTSSTPDSFIWIDVSGDRMAVYCGMSEAFTPSSELDCTTTTLSTTTLPTTTESPGHSTQPTHDSATSQSTTDDPPAQLPAADKPTTEESSGPSVIAIVGLTFGIFGTLVSLILAFLLMRPHCKKLCNNDVGDSGETPSRSMQNEYVGTPPSGTGNTHLYPQWQYQRNQQDPLQGDTLRKVRSPANGTPGAISGTSEI